MKDKQEMDSIPDAWMGNLPKYPAPIISYQT